MSQQKLESIGRAGIASVLSERHRRVLLLILVVLILALHGVLWWWGLRGDSSALWGDQKLYVDTAQKCLAGQPDWQPDTLWPALYSQFVAGLIALPGPWLITIRLVQSFLLLVTAFVFADLFETLSGSRCAARMAGVVLVAYPPLVAFAHLLWPEVLHLFLLACVLWILIKRGTSWLWAAVAGLVLGVALLTKNLLAPFAPILLVAWIVVQRKKPILAPALVLVIAAAATVSPTLIANQNRIGKAMIADSSLFNLWVGLNDRQLIHHRDDVAWREYLAYRSSGATVAERDRVLVAKIRDLVQQRGLVKTVAQQLGKQYFRLFDRSSYLTDQLSGGAIARKGLGYSDANTGVAAVVRAVSYSMYVLILMLAPMGFLFWPFAEKAWSRILMLFVFYNLGLFLVLHAMTRYRIQFLPILVLGATLATVLLADRRDLLCRPGCSWRWVVATCCAVLGLVFACAGPWVNSLLSG